MSGKRKDNKERILKTGESRRSYRYYPLGTLYQFETGGTLQYQSRIQFCAESDQKRGFRVSADKGY